MMVLITILIVAATIGIISHYVLYKEGDVYVTPVTGVLVGALSTTDVQELYDNETEEFAGYQKAHTIQIALFFITFTFVWTEEIEGH